MKISVIIPIHNLGEQIVICLNSILSQDFKKTEYEVLTVLDCCTDGTEKIIRDWQAEHTDVNMTLLYSQSKTPGGARNVGLDNAEGEYILFVDGDDWLVNNNAMTILYNAVQGHNAVRVMDHEMKGSHTKFSERLTIWLHFFSRILIGSERFTDMLLNEDYEFVKRIRDKEDYNENIVTTPLYYYNYDGERMIERIKTVRKETIKRKRQGLPPLYVSDEFTVLQ